MLDNFKFPGPAAEAATGVVSVIPRALSMQTYYSRVDNCFNRSRDYVSKIGAARSGLGTNQLVQEPPRNGPAKACFRTCCGRIIEELFQEGRFFRPSKKMSEIYPSCLSLHDN